MGGTPEFFYNRGIENAYLEDPMLGSPYTSYLNEYMQLEEAIDYVSIDPMGD